MRPDKPSIADQQQAVRNSHARIALHSVEIADSPLVRVVGDGAQRTVGFLLPFHRLRLLGVRDFLRLLVEAPPLKRPIPRFLSRAKRVGAPSRRLDLAPESVKVAVPRIDWELHTVRNRWHETGEIA